MTTSSEPSPAARPPRLLRSRTGLLCVALLLLSCLVGAASMSDTNTNFLDLAKILSVVSFVGSMVALAIGMVGDSYRS